jgi:hypothetical protein
MIMDGFSAAVDFRLMVRLCKGFTSIAWLMGNFRVIRGYYWSYIWIGHDNFILRDWL